MTASSGTATADHVGGSQDKAWIPRFWDGMNLSAWARLLVQNRFRVSPRRLPMAAIITGFSGMNSLLSAAQSAFYGRRIRETEITAPPIFIIGHWRSGTTLLHELLICDQRHTYPDTYSCFAPNHFVMTNRVLRPVLAPFVPDRRPMDNMPAGCDRPQEEEFALCNMGVPSPYLFMAFPNEPRKDQEYLDFAGLSSKDVERWKASLVWFLKCLTAIQPRRVVLKSPPHTARMAALKELFPGARFVHIYRDPYVVFPSTVNLWKRLSKDQGLQIARNEGLEEYVFQTFSRMYAAFERDRASMAPGELCDVRYEDLVARPVEEIGRVYRELALGDFDAARPAVEAYLASQSDYQKNHYRLAPELEREITRRWAPFIQKYGYSPRAGRSEAA